MPKLGLWVDDEMNEGLDQLHQAMLADPLLRDLKLTKTDVIKMLMRRSLPMALLEHGIFEEGADPMDAFRVVEDQQRKQELAFLGRLREYNARREREHSARRE
jgi:hypothetical protein